MNLQDSVASLKGVGKKRLPLLEKLHIETIEDLLRFFPRRYEDRRQAVPIMTAPIGKEVLIIGTVMSKQMVGSPYSRRRLLKVQIEDNTGSLELLFFNGKFLESYFKPGEQMTFFGKITLNNGRRQMAHPEFHKLGDAKDVRGLLPVYPLTEGLTQANLRAWQQQARGAIGQITEWLPLELVETHHLCSPAYAIEQIHFPQEERPVLESRYRLIFEELLILQTGLFYMKHGASDVKKGVRFAKEADVEPFLSSFPFQLTAGQARCWHEIERDLESARPMNRLIQGDVGSGKTAIAQLAMYKAVKSGYQAAMMAPTELLAKQHYANLKKSFDSFGIRTALLSSSTKTAERRLLLEALASGEIDILLGTHAILQPDVVFARPGLFITDEQHRFGVNQREVLQAKGENPNVLVMTATPIPRTLAVILYGDLDISVIDTLPAGRKPIRTFLRDQNARPKIYDFVEAQIRQGRQAYVVAPLIEESESIDCRSAQEIYEELRARYPRLRIGLAHGAMKQQEKDAVMEAFQRRDLDMLVSTVVIEVGIDVSNATVMVIENCERFGLAQLHQLRGRVGRGSEQSYCILVSGSDSQIARKRNEILCSTEDGFVIAEEDLKLRGPGEIFGTRQHGLPELNLSDLVRNADILEKARAAAKTMIETDPALIAPQHQILKQKIQKMFGERIQLRL